MPERVMTPESEKYAKIGKLTKFKQELPTKSSSTSTSWLLAAMRYLLISSAHYLTPSRLPPVVRISVDMNVVNQVAKFGFPQSTIINSLRKNLANHCTTSYYLLLMD